MATGKRDKSAGDKNRNGEKNRTGDKNQSGSMKKNEDKSGRPMQGSQKNAQNQDVSQRAED